jgi:hypothetical protein
MEMDPVRPEVSKAGALWIRSGEPKLTSWLEKRVQATKEGLRLIDVFYHVPKRDDVERLLSKAAVVYIRA